MNFVLGDNAPNNEVASYGGKRLLRLGELVQPSMNWLMIGEHPDSINNVYFPIDLNKTQWVDMPGSLHNNACNLSFTDGHTESKKWVEKSTLFPVRKKEPCLNFQPAGVVNFPWLKDRIQPGR